ncbi:MAG: glycine cleavage system protein GcvH [Coprobacillus sp.]|nr:glycine cleavage system protein GcvH [Coprobacillus sp.]MDY4144993.1 glycine cleavage system protein GcvH [Bacilli bacterium]OLA05377.1 MAG: glycine cleavage system protein H [Coprobacillus sp. 28_7]CCY06913.1 glycine cleavage system H protein [Coprobacillus sp. CAG:698]
MSKVLENLFYSETHEWARVEGNIAYVGVTDYAQANLGSVVYVEALEIGDEVEQFDEAGAIESVKAASDIMSPLSGVVIEVNDDVIDNPELINEDPYTNWIFKLELSDASEVDNLLSKEDYEKEIDE